MRAIFGGNARENATAGVTSAATYYIGHEGGFTDGERYLLHGALTSASYAANGGNAVQGFFVGFTSAGVNGYIAGVNTGNGFTDYAVKVTLSSMYGGAVSVAMGGSFSDGASNAARIMLMSEMGNVVNDKLTRMAMQGGGKYVSAKSATNEAVGYGVRGTTTVEKLEIASGTLGVLGFAFAPFKALSVAIDALSFGTSAGHSYVTNDPTSFTGHLAGPMERQ